MSGPPSSVASRVLHALDEWAGRAWLAGIASALTTGALAVILLTGGSDHALVLYTVAVEAVTLVLVFVVQHTQNRHQKVIQRKLDELLATHDDADDRVVHLEDAPDDEIEAQRGRHQQRRIRAVTPKA